MDVCTKRRSAEFQAHGCKEQELKKRRKSCDKQPATIRPASLPFCTAGKPGTGGMSVPTPAQAQQPGNAWSFPQSPFPLMPFMPPPPFCFPTMLPQMMSMFPAFMMQQVMAMQALAGMQQSAPPAGCAAATPIQNASVAATSPKAAAEAASNFLMANASNDSWLSSSTEDDDFASFIDSFLNNASVDDDLASFSPASQLDLLALTPSQLDLVATDVGVTAEFAKKGDVLVVQQPGSV